jgi:hypothetical protein
MGVYPDERIALGQQHAGLMCPTKGKSLSVSGWEQEG